LKALERCRIVAPVENDSRESFDATLSAFPTRRVPIERVVDPLGISHAENRITAYREAMLRGERFPPISVVSLAGRFLVADGHNRFAAYRPLGGGEIVVEIWTIRRWLADQRAQLARKSWQIASLAVRSFYDEDARGAARRLRVDTVGHWKRILASLASQLRGAFRG